MKTAEIRQRYLDFFVARDHRVVPSSALVPNNDPTLMFTNSGMVQFKEALIGVSVPSYKRATSAQRCVRAGGKHNDLENVGYTARHHTFFEMMGNFSFGDYFKEETIRWAWAFITEELKLPMDRLLVTVHPEDAQSRALWTQVIGFSSDRVIDIAENFWAMGDTGPCGPCTEIFYDHGPDVPGGPPGSPDEDGDRFVEFWNLVFPQFDRAPDGTLTNLPKPGVDTGMGLERVAAIMQGVHSNYEIDVFSDLMRTAASIAGINDPQVVRSSPSLRVIADHIRSCSFLIADGVTPSNEDRGYVLRRIIRRALRHGHKLGIKDAFFHKLVAPLVREMGGAYPILAEQEQRVTKTLLAEEQRFTETLAQGMELLEGTIRVLKGKVIPGDIAFRLYDTFGFPADLTADVARERGLSVDMTGFEVEMDKQRARARAASKFDADIGQRIRVDSTIEFLGYDTLDAEATVLDLYSLEDGDVKRVEALEAGAAGVVILDRSPFYAESGGQVGDVGVIEGAGCSFAVSDTTGNGAQYLHRGNVSSGTLKVGSRINAHVGGARRACTAANHSATHLLHAALRKVLGTHVQQKGSLVDHERLRFDFSHAAPVTEGELDEIESLVNEEVRRNTPVATDLMAFDAAIEHGAMALFGEKYGDRVRVLTMGEGFSVELCGGTHVRRTGDIGLFRIMSEAGVAAGVRRIEAAAGAPALAYTHQAEADLKEVARLLKSSRRDLTQKARALLEAQRDLQRELAQAKARLAASQSADLVDGMVTVAGVKVLAARVSGLDAKGLLTTLDTLKAKIGSGVVLLVQPGDAGVDMIAGITKDLTAKLKAGDAVKAMAPLIGAKGGGRPDMARAGGGTKPEGIDALLAAVPAWVESKL